MAFNENTRVKIPAILHLCRLGYQYLSLQSFKRDEGTNIAADIFKETIQRNLLRSAQQKFPEVA